jgi:AraC-like DNA-binding protein
VNSSQSDRTTGDLIGTARAPRTGLIFAVRRLHAPALEAFHEDSEVRSPALRVAIRAGRNVTTDYGLVERAFPFSHRMKRPQISIVLAGEGRAEENGRRVWIRRGTFLASDGGARRRARMVYGGSVLRQVLVEWDPSVFGAPFDRELDLSTLGEEDCARLGDAASRAVGGRGSRSALVELFAILKSAGVPFDSIDESQLPEESADPVVEGLHAAIATQLSALQRYPGSIDLASMLGWNARTMHRRVAELSDAYALPWTHWRSALHSQRMMDATRLLAAKGATTEAVARLTGFRAPSALCHAFAKAGLPSPGLLARAARRDPLDTWTQFAPSGAVEAPASPA